jgi:hypothetical protein
MRKILAVGVLIVVIAVSYLDTFGWGWDAHRFFNRNTVYHLPYSMALFIQDSSFFALHSIDADQRRVPGDTSLYAEAPRHFLDIDNYPNFQNLPRSLDTLIALYGWEWVKQNGTNPWATVWCFDSLVDQLGRGDWPKATLTASDLGHYVGDAHQPLHVTRNYNGQYTNNYGIHSRYESTMLSPAYYLSALFIVPDSVEYVSDPINFIFDYVLHSNSLVDTILQADDHAKIVSGWNGSGTPPPSYYAALWDRTRVMTLDQMQRGTRSLSSLWYTAWVDAGLITPASLPPPATTHTAAFCLDQNFPNPFNPVTTISYTLPVGGTASLKVFSVDGREVAELVRDNQSVGRHSLQFDASGLATGIYFYQLQLGKFSQTRKLLILR